MSRRRASYAVAAALVLAGLTVAVSADTVHPNAAAAAESAGSPAAGTYRTVGPARLLDTRSGIGGHTPGAMGTVQLLVLGHGGVPASDVSAVVLNVTVTAPTGPGFIAVYPHGSAVPTASNVNFVRGQTVANLVVASVGADGSVDLLNHSAGPTQLVADVSGYFVSGTATDPGSYSPLAPARLMDTRIHLGAGTLAPNSRAQLAVDGHDGIPASGVAAVVMNVTVTQPRSQGVITVYPDGTTRPGSSNLNFAAGQNVPNLVVARVGADGDVDFWNTSNGATDLIADVQGYLLAGTPVDPGVFVPAGPTRALDTRSTLGGLPVGGHRTLSLAIAGDAGVPATEVRAVVLNVTLTGPIAPGFITVYPDGTPLPTASNLNFTARQTVPNLVVAPVGSDGKIDFYNGSSNTVQLIADVEGYDTGVLGEPGASCTGFTNSTGITDSTISIANASDVSGPVSSLDASAQQATQAYAAYFDAGADVCGRTVTVDALDTETSADSDQAAATAACADDFAMVGSMSTFDDGGAATAAACGIPDLRAGTSSIARQSAADVYAIHYADLDQIPATVPSYFVQHDAAAVAHAAYLYLDLGNAQAEANSEIRGWTAQGFTFAYISGIGDTTLNYGTFVTKMQMAGVQYVQFDGPYQYAVRLMQAMRAQNFTPIVVVDPVAVDPGFIATGGADVDGAFSFTDASLFTDTPTPADTALYEHWLQVVSPGATPTTFGLYAWSAAMLFTDRALGLGGGLTRTSLLTSLSGIHAWTGNGLHTAQDVGGKTVAPCQSIIQVSHSAWTRVSAGQYVCGAVVPTAS